MLSNIQKWLTTEDSLAAVLAFDIETGSFSEDETSSESSAKDFLDEHGNKCSFSVLPTIVLCFVPDPCFRQFFD